MRWAELPRFLRRAQGQGEFPLNSGERPVQSSELELYTTTELIAELMRRKTFLGVVVHSAQEFKSNEWTGRQVFRVHFNSNLDAARAGRLLDAVAGQIDRRVG
jgi:hypothetical protein